MNQKACIVASLLLVLAIEAQARDFTFTWSRWSLVTQGVLQDSSTGLQWTQEDNGADVDWNSATQYCQGSTWAGGGWRLPSVEELAAIHDASGAITAPCGEYTCHVSPLFHLTSFGFWSGARNGSAEAWSVVLNYGYRYSIPVGDPFNKRALCVRRF